MSWMPWWITPAVGILCRGMLLAAISQLAITGLVFAATGQNPPSWVLVLMGMCATTSGAYGALRALEARR